MDRGTAQYLGRYAEAEASLSLERLGVYQHVLVVPVCGESPDFLNGYRAAATQGSGRVLVIVVVNAPDAAPEELHRANAALLTRFRAELFELVELGSGAPRAAFGRTNSFDAIVVDRTLVGERLGRREGVGRARRIGCDLALALGAAKKLVSPWIHTTDGDASLPGDYFARTEGAAASSLLYPFSHVPSGDEALDRATALYEVWLRYYVLGLFWAGSAYAYHSLGSTIAVSRDAYARVRGFPRRAGGEDFHLLNKVSKLAPVRLLGGEPVAIRTRRSERVPIGTGPRVSELERQLGRGQEPRFYAPGVFVALRATLGNLEQFCRTRRREALATALDGLPAQASEASLEFLTTEGAERVFERAAREARSPADLRRRIHTWLDALRTLKLVHALERTAFPRVSWREALAEAPFIDAGTKSLREPAELCSALSRQAAALPEMRGPTAPFAAA